MYLTKSGMSCFFSRRNRNTILVNYSQFSRYFYLGCIHSKSQVKLEEVDVKSGEEDEVRDVDAVRSNFEH